jgi:hypothetical protein
VRLRSNRSEALLERLVYGTPEPSWQLACPQPCGLRLDNRYDDRVGGAGVPPSARFALKAASTSL